MIWYLECKGRCSIQRRILIVICVIYCSEILAFESISIFSVIHMQSRIHARKVDNDFSWKHHYEDCFIMNFVCPFFSHDTWLGAFISNPALTTENTPFLNRTGVELSWPSYLPHRWQAFSDLMSLIVGQVSDNFNTQIFLVRHI